MKLNSTVAGSRTRPYKLHLPAAIYKREGSNLGFDFSSEEIARASQTDQFLGIEQYFPKGESTIKFGIPPGAYVKCYISRHVI